ncbi:MAG: hypothetical protein CMJ64_18390 [Planctomycetaceae bacterium]|nr:hypothetical protein [Planctomycetaceae bacterium]
MAQPRLRIYYGPSEEQTATVHASEERVNTVTVPLGDIFPLLADALQNESSWLRDFEDDEITISSDLYEVVLAYQHFRRPSA